MRDSEDYEARKPISKCKAMLIWTCEKERRKLCGKKDDGDGSAR